MRKPAVTAFSPLPRAPGAELLQLLYIMETGREKLPVKEVVSMTSNLEMWRKAVAQLEEDET